jgi:hypothetical protein
MGVTATARRHPSPATPRRHPSSPLRSQTCEGVCDRAPPHQPRHATPPRLQPLALANAWGCLRQRAATSAPPRHTATPPAPCACKCVGVSATTRHHAGPTTSRHHFAQTVLLIYLYYTVCSLVYCCIKVVNRPFTAKKVVLGKFGSKLIQTQFEPKPNFQFRFQFGVSCPETKPFGFWFGQLLIALNGFKLSLNLGFLNLVFFLQYPYNNNKQLLPNLRKCFQTL